MRVPEKLVPKEVGALIALELVAFLDIEVLMVELPVAEGMLEEIDDVVFVTGTGKTGIWFGRTAVQSTSSLILSTPRRERRV